ncbi:hypothetical protein SAMN05216276_1009196 [Streptosporangium subroseum]|uniref:Uncharacterized protein n=1 Tax=Streptosporangium subroseum TaxID=106412 RepID=A0A239EMK8_9ACTN|nr:hypothetical protein SAMN05216276_1009196 [Streptosporangium subroseum]
MRLLRRFSSEVRISADQGKKEGVPNGLGFSTLYSLPPLRNAALVGDDGDAR